MKDLMFGMLIGGALGIAAISVVVSPMAKPTPEFLSIRTADNPEGRALANELMAEDGANGNCTTTEWVGGAMPIWTHTCIGGVR